MTDKLFLNDAYLKTATGRVVGHSADGGIILDQSLFYATSGGQACDLGSLTVDGQTVSIIDVRKGLDQDIVIYPDGAQLDLLPIGTKVAQTIDWDRRYAHMRYHTALHLLSVVIPRPVTGGSITDAKARLDFDMPEAPDDKEAIERALNHLIAQNFAVSETWVSDAELDANPALVKTMSVQPPRGSGKIRMVKIGSDTEQIDLQPCGGTHVAKTGEIGPIRLGKIEKKGKQNRRINLFFED